MFESGVSFIAAIVMGHGSLLWRVEKRNGRGLLRCSVFVALDHVVDELIPAPQLLGHLIDLRFIGFGFLV